MKILNIFLIFIMVFSSISLIGCIKNEIVDIKYRSTDEFIPKIKQGTMSFNVTIRTNDIEQNARLWLPYPVSNDYQTVENVVITGNYNYSGIHREAANGNMILYAEWTNPDTYPQLTLTFNISRNEINKKNFPESEGEIPIEMEEFLQPTYLGPTDGIVEKKSIEITEGKTTILEKAIVIYDYLIEHGERDPNLNFCGDGDVCKLLENLRGKCVDFSSVFVALSRSAGIPAREILGIRISQDGDITGSYHCQAEFYLPDYGWVPVDPSDVAKLILNEDLSIDDPKVDEARDYFFGAQTETYIELSKGRDLILNPLQNAGPLNYLMYPYAEVDGEPLDFISQEYLKYTVTFFEK